MPGGLFALAVQRGCTGWWLLLPLAVVDLGAGACQRRARHGRRVVLGFTVPVLAGTHRPPAEHFEHRLRPVSAGVAVPVFAFFAAGVTVGGWSGLGDSLPHPVTVGVIAGLVIGKPIGVFITTFLLARFTQADARRRSAMA